LSQNVEKTVLPAAEFVHCDYVSDIVDCGV